MLHVLRRLVTFLLRMWSFFIAIIRINVRAIQSYESVTYRSVLASPWLETRLKSVPRKTLVLDLDETLIHSHHDGFNFARQMAKPSYPPDFILKVVELERRVGEIERRPTRFFVHKRPHVDYFLDVVSQWYDLAVFTASVEVYGAAVADKLDSNRNVLNRRFYRQHCTTSLLTGFAKDLTKVSSDLSSVVLIDNSPGAYRDYPNNAIPIESWISDPYDTCLLNMLPVLDALRFCYDVRSLLGRNLHQHNLWPKPK
ncbi:CTD nuclear envelope phosphatase 1-like [Oscarella lobularis]|uniref:CTD nuclear envelope phosphatase 1-like n=1 Tax=Oscarella lobularis TaxID=121494 RepID=UPI003314316F